MVNTPNWSLQNDIFIQYAVAPSNILQAIHIPQIGIGM